VEARRLSGVDLGKTVSIAGYPTRELLALEHHDGVVRLCLEHWGWTSVKATELITVTGRAPAVADRDDEFASYELPTPSPGIPAPAGPTKEDDR
jgi:hypothetical protein